MARYPPHIRRVRGWCQRSLSPGDTFYSPTCDRHARHAMRRRGGSAARPFSNALCALDVTRRSPRVPSLLHPPPACPSRHARDSAQSPRNLRAISRNPSARRSPSAKSSADPASRASPISSRLRMNSTATPTQILDSRRRLSHAECVQRSERRRAVHQLYPTGIRPTSICILPTIPYPYPALPYPTRDYCVIGVRHGLSALAYSLRGLCRRACVAATSNGQREHTRAHTPLVSILFLCIHYFRPPTDPLFPDATQRTRTIIPAEGRGGCTPYFEASPPGPWAPFDPSIARRVYLTGKLSPGRRWLV